MKINHVCSIAGPWAAKNRLTVKALLTSVLIVCLCRTLPSQAQSLIKVPLPLLADQRQQVALDDRQRRKVVRKAWSRCRSGLFRRVVADLADHAFGLGQLCRHCRPAIGSNAFKGGDVITVAALTPAPDAENIKFVEMEDLGESFYAAD